MDKAQDWVIEVQISYWDEPIINRSEKKEDVVEEKKEEPLVKISEQAPAKVEEAKEEAVQAETKPAEEAKEEAEKEAIQAETKPAEEAKEEKKNLSIISQCTNHPINHALKHGIQQPVTKIQHKWARKFTAVPKIQPLFRQVNTAIIELLHEPTTPNGRPKYSHKPNTKKPTSPSTLETKIHHKTDKHRTDHLCSPIEHVVQTPRSKIKQHAIHIRKLIAISRASTRMLEYLMFVQRDPSSRKTRPGWRIERERTVPIDMKAMKPI
ncbi:P-loop containing nucleoside triphosphatehydrolases superfamily protein [Striga asiatica]|uniref:P-loop containing nucleoside triphosphatehydrolases superfamily protein n=1 Tax=Striga asiatica TaxID=4170 RepID=A0A5A7QMZ4_STRAF|nr:P-loop containing nucleoside triphosphatehydrolases superfamily protein [Striga asiatica]